MKNPVIGHVGKNDGCKREFLRGSRTSESNLNFVRVDVTF